MRAALFAAMVLIGGCTTDVRRTQRHSDDAVSSSFNVPLLMAGYQQNNQHEVPVVSYMIYGTPQILVYPDGKVLTKAGPEEKGRSGLALAQLSSNELAAVLASVASVTGFYSLSNMYRLSRWSEQPLHTLSVRLPGRPEKSVSVYGRLEKPRPDDMTAPPEFLNLIAVFLSIHPKPSSPWNPGYVEIGFADYSYAPDPSLQWPASWPSLSSPLVRDVKGWVIKKVMVFPSQRLKELDSFLKREPERGAILIGDWKACASYRWPLPGEKYWTSWNK